MLHLSAVTFYCTNRAVIVSRLKQLDRFDQQAEFHQSRRLWNQLDNSRRRWSMVIRSAAKPGAG
jgi:hypothetical protein